MYKGTVEKNNRMKTPVIIITIILLLLLIGVIFYSLQTYKVIQTNKNKHLNNIKMTILNDEVLADVYEIYEFHDEQSYYILKGSNEEGIEQFVFVSTKDENEQIVVKVDDTISEEEAIKNSTKNCGQCEVVKVSPAMIGKLSLWEVIYYDDQERYVIEYISMKTGQQVEQLRLASKYK